MNKKRAIFIDRDGVLNSTGIRGGKPYAPKSFEEFHLLPGVSDALFSLKNFDCLLIVVTNQPDVGNGIVEKEIVEKMHLKLLNELPIDSLKACYHKQTDGCKCRKPKPGMILESASEFNIELDNSYMVGDRKSDIEAGIQAGCKTVFIEQGYTKNEQPEYVDIVANSLPDAVTKIIFEISNNKIT